MALLQVARRSFARVPVSGVWNRTIRSVNFTDGAQMCYVGAWSLHELQGSRKISNGGDFGVASNLSRSFSTATAAVVSATAHGSRNAVVRNTIKETEPEFFVDTPLGMPTSKEELAHQESNRKKFAFPYVLSTSVAMQDSEFNPEIHALRFKSKLSVKLTDLNLSKDQESVFRKLVGNRERDGVVSFVSRHLPTQQLNEDLVFEQLEKCLAESRRLNDAFVKNRSKVGRSPETP